MAPDALLPVLAHVVISSAPHAEALLTLGAAAIVVGSGALVVVGIRLEDRAVSDEGRSVPLRDAWRVVIAAASVGAAVIHFSVVGVHAEADPLQGLLFAIAAWMQVAVGAAVVTTPGRRALRSLAVVNALAILAWSWSRTVGIPFGPEAWVPEPIGVVDALATAFELIAAIIATALLVARDGAPGRARLSSAVVYAGTAVLVVAVATTIALVGYPPAEHAEAAATAPAD